MRIVEAILRDQSTVLSISSQVKDYYGVSDVCLSLPAVISRAGVESQLRLALNPQEQQGLRQSADVLKQTIASLDLNAQAA